MVPVSFYEKWHQMKSTRFLWKIVHVIGKVYGAIVWIINLSPIYSWWNLYRVFLKLGEVQGDQTQTVYIFSYPNINCAQPIPEDNEQYPDFFHVAVELSAS